LRITLEGPLEFQISLTLKLFLSGVSFRRALPWFSPDEMNTLPPTAMGVVMLQS